MSYNSGAGARRALVTGCAGFIGSHLSERLVADGCEVVGVDAFTPFYDRESKNANLERLHQEPGFELREVDLATDDLDGLADGVDVIFHLAGEPGVRQSFGPGAGAYVRNNIEATSRLISEVAREPDRPFVFASSSTVYGDALSFPTPEASPLRPISPYGRTKAAAEEIVALAHERSGLASVGLRYFSAYGPRQRPDMAFRRFIEAAMDGRSVPVYGTGEQRRDFTYVDDIVEATVARPSGGVRVTSTTSAAARPPPCWRPLACFRSCSSPRSRSTFSRRARATPWRPARTRTWRRWISASPRWSG